MSQPRPDFSGLKCDGCRLPLGRYYDRVVRLAPVEDADAEPSLVCSSCRGLRRRPAMPYLAAFLAAEAERERERR